MCYLSRGTAPFSGLTSRSSRDRFAARLTRNRVPQRRAATQSGLTQVLALKIMFKLDHKIPPPVIALVCAGLAWALARYTPEFSYPRPGRLPIAALLVLLGFALDISGILVFRSAKTTVNPLSPEKSTSIVQVGPYKFTRNPVYVGMAIFLLAYGVYLANPLSVLAVVLFVAYITRFQIIPEERFLLSKFGESYASYTRSVRRWL